MPHGREVMLQLDGKLGGVRIVCAPWRRRKSAESPEARPEHARYVAGVEGQPEVDPEKDTW